jgi:MSHA biogenesis protein MshJ
MAEAIRDVLSRQKTLRLVSLRNLPALSLAEAKEAAQPRSGPYLHPVEIVVEGSYLDTVLYVQALERLPWRFYWRRLELQTLDYPVNRVRIELGTLSMEKEWIGI